MKTLEWTTVDKSKWPRGQWDKEPDKRQWRDGATGFPCLAVRNGRGGNWCGYVGVHPEHPLHGKSYNDVDVDVHGGLTFADRCTPHDTESWELFRERQKGDADEAKQYPVGDAAQRLADPMLQAALGDPEAYREYVQSHAICHLPEPGEADDVWWFGFDCAHAWDLRPGAEYRSELDHDAVYRSLRYVEAEARRLAEQIAGITA